MASTRFPSGIAWSSTPAIPSGSGVASGTPGARNPRPLTVGRVTPWYTTLVSFDGITWESACVYDFGNWVMELILTPVDVEEGPAKPEGKLTLLPVHGGFYITGYKGPARVYDPTGRLIMSKEVKGKTLIGPLGPGVYFVVAGRQRARVAVS